MLVEDSLSLVGTTVADKYVVESLVGEGGFAVVYRAQHKLWKRPVALKVFKALGEVPAEDRDKLLEDFIREGALLAELSEKSASICQARDVGMMTTPGGMTVPYMVLEWLEGRSLEAVLIEEREALFPPRAMDEAVRLIEPAAEGLALAHKQGIAHRDVKPANIFLLGDPRGESCPVKLLDFGIAKVVQDAQKVGGAFTKTGGQVTSFTPAYGAPEQFSRSYGSTGPWTDVFALALVLVEMVIGRAPLEGEDFMQIAYASADKAVRPTPRTRGAGVSDQVEAVFNGALAVSPSDRYRTVGQFWNALRVALGMDPLKGLDMPSGAALPGRISQVSSPRAVAPPASGPRSSVASPYAVTPPTSQSVSTAQTSVSPTGPTTFGPGSKPLGVEPEFGSLPSTSTTHRRPTDGSRSRTAVLALGAGAFVLLGGMGGAFFMMRPDAGRAANSSAAASPGAGGTASGGAAPAPPVASSSAAVAPAGEIPSRPPGAHECPEGMVKIAGGLFFMGGEEASDLPQEKPTHQVKLSPYCIDKTEVTTEAYVQCSDTGKCERASIENDFAGISDHDREVYDPLCNERATKERGHHPINCVTWEMAQSYCVNRGGRLPTEAEWEFAARGPDGRKYPWGNDEPTGGHLNACGAECVAWAKANHVEDVKAMYKSDDKWPNTAPVGSFPAGNSPFGLEDVVGNVWEWVADYYGPYTKEPQVDPKGPVDGKKHVIRGGAWNGSEVSWVRPTFRWRDDPKTKSHGIGFRCAANPK
jgi:eukaryotic-like serine/threonine-protein kinase